MTLSYRASHVLSRFPKHLGLDAPGTLASTIVEALAHDLDLQSEQVGEIRRSRRLATAPTRRDLLQLAALHDFRPEHFSIAQDRFELLYVLAQGLRDVSATQEQQDIAWRKMEQLLGFPNQLLQADPNGLLDLAPFQALVLDSLDAAIRYENNQSARRRVLIGAVATHRQGNGHVAAVLQAAAAYLDLEAGKLGHSSDRSWHWLRVHPQLALAAASDWPADGRYKTRHLVLEENPVEQRVLVPAARTHGQRFVVERLGFEDAWASISVEGQNEATHWPMVVNAQDGTGVWWCGRVEDGDVLQFGDDGTVTLNGSSVSERAYSFRGGVFADRETKFASDFVFGSEEPVLPAAALERVATFSETVPYADGFSADRVFPHASGSIASLRVPVGTTRWYYFVAAPTWGSDDEHGIAHATQPAFAGGYYDESAFCPSTDPCGIVGFRWKQRRPFFARLWLPDDLRVFDEGQIEQEQLPARLLRLLARHRPAGIELEIEYANDLWLLGEGRFALPDEDSPIGVELLGTTLWPDDTPQPEF